MNKTTKEIALFFILLLSVVTILLVQNLTSPTILIQTIGVSNSYIVLFIISFLGGFSSGGSVLFFTTLTTFILGGLNEIVAGTTAGIALAIGDTIMLLLFLSGRKLVSGKTKKNLDRFSGYLNKKPQWLIPIITFIYIGFAPLPNDLMILSLAAIKYPQKKAIALFALGDITFALFYSVLISQGINFLL
jgi:hypothetical protein